MITCHDVPPFSRNVDARRGGRESSGEGDGGTCYRRSDEVFEVQILEGVAAGDEARGAVSFRSQLVGGFAMVVW